MNSQNKLSKYRFKQRRTSNDYDKSQMIHYDNVRIIEFNYYIIININKYILVTYSPMILYFERNILYGRNNFPEEESNMEMEKRGRENYIKLHNNIFGTVTCI